MELALNVRLVLAQGLRAADQVLDRRFSQTNVSEGQEPARDLYLGIDGEISRIRSEGVPLRDRSNQGANPQNG